MSLLVRPPNWGMLNQVVHLMLVWVVEWGNSNQHLINQDAQCPPIKGSIMSWPNNHLWRQVLRRPTERVWLFCFWFYNLGQTKVSKHDVAILIEQDILRLQVSVEDVWLVQVAKSQCNLSSIELSLLFTESLFFWQVFEEFASLNEVHNEVDSVRLLEHIVHANDEWVIHLVQNQFLNLQTVDGLVLDDHVFSDTFHGVEFATDLALHQIHFAKGASANDRNKLEVVPSRPWESLSSENQLTLLTLRLILLFLGEITVELGWGAVVDLLLEFLYIWNGVTVCVVSHFNRAV